MTTQQNADRLLLVFQGNKHLSAPLRERAIDEAILVAANSNHPYPAEAFYRAQQATVASIMGAR
jgi:hypothetical protein